VSGQQARDRRGVKRLRLSPLRYPGGKGSLYPHLREVVRTNGLVGGTYVEPYAGGAGAALSLLITGQVRRIVINDLDPAVYAFWRSAVRQPDEFAALTRDAKLDVDEWRRQRELYLSAKRSDYLALGFATFYLNRTNYSGALDGGPIGGLDQSGNYKIDARFNKVALLERLRLISLYARKITVLKKDGLDVISQYAGKDRTFIYADPPYFDKAGSLYMNSFTADDHAELADCLNSRSDCNWLLTYDNVPQVAQLYGTRYRETFTLHYSAHRVTRATEVMVFSDNLKPPPASSSATVRVVDLPDCR
jgi:DNA adenine methylase